MATELIELGCVSGLGDILTRSFLRDAYFNLQNLKKPADILLFSPNPYVSELLQFHPKRENFRIHTFSMYPDFQKKHFSPHLTAQEKKQNKLDFLQKNFGSYVICPSEVLPPDACVEFHLSPEEKKKMASWRAKDYAVIQFFSSAADKDIPKPVLLQLLSVLYAQGLDLYILLRSNVRSGHAPNSLDAETQLKKMLAPLPFRRQVGFINESIPMVIEIIRNACFFAGSDSAFIKAAWYHRIPNLLLMPDSLAERTENKQQLMDHKGIYFGAGYPCTLWRKSSQFKMDELHEFAKEKIKLKNNVPVFLRRVSRHLISRTQKISEKEVVPLLFSGGIGDLLAHIVFYDTYACLNEYTSPVDVLLLSPNPYAAEILKNHPNRKNLRIYTMEMYPAFQKKSFSDFSGGPEEKKRFNEAFLSSILGVEYYFRKPKLLPAGTKLEFFLSDQEKAGLKELQNQPYAVVQPFASHEVKDIPSSVLISCLNSLTGKGLKVYLPLRKNVRASHSKSRFDPYVFLEKKILSKVRQPESVMMETRSIPFVINLIRGASFFMGPDSAFIKAAWHYAIPSILLLPDAALEKPHTRRQFEAKEGIYFGAAMPNTLCVPFSGFDEAKLNDFIKMNIPASA